MYVYIYIHIYECVSEYVYVYVHIYICRHLPLLSLLIVVTSIQTTLRYHLRPEALLWQVGPFPSGEWKQLAVPMNHMEWSCLTLFATNKSTSNLSET